MLGVMSQAARHVLVVTALAAAAALVGCTNTSPSSDPYAGSRDPYGYGNPGSRTYGSDPYYGGTRVEVIDRNAERLERIQDEEREDLEEEQNDEQRDLKRAQEQQREALKNQGQWDSQDKRQQKDERKQQKKSFEQEDKELEKQQRQEWKDRY